MVSLVSLPADTVSNLRDRDRRWGLQVATRLVSSLFAFIAFVILAATVHKSTSEYGGNDWTDGFPLAPLLIALLYNLFIIPFNIYHRIGKSIHPAFSLTADLFVWALGVPAIIFCVGVGWFWWWTAPVFEFEDGSVPCVGPNIWSKVCSPLIYKLGKQEIAASVFLALVIIMHFVLFIRGCILTHRHRMQKKNTAATRRNIELQYHRSPEEHQREAPPAYSFQEPQRESALGSASPVSPISVHETVTKFA